MQEKMNADRNVELVTGFLTIFLLTVFCAFFISGCAVFNHSPLQTVPAAGNNSASNGSTVGGGSTSLKNETNVTRVYIPSGKYVGNVTNEIMHVIVPSFVNTTCIKPEGCSNFTQFICGSNNVTYQNFNFVPIQFAQYGQYYYGTCEETGAIIPGTDCLDTHDFVCGKTTTGKDITFVNECIAKTYFQKYLAKFEYNGKC